MRDASQFGSNTPQTTGNWAFGSDTSQHKAGIIATDVPGVYGLGDGQQVTGFITKTQLLKLTEDVQEGRYDSLLAD